MNVKPLLKLMVEKKASDLFFAPFAPAKIKIEGKIMPVNKLEMSPKMVKQAALELMSQEQMDVFTKELEIDFALSEEGLGRFRVNVFHQRGNVAMVLRYITADLPTLDELGMPVQLKELIMLKRGLILMVGATGCGKSTTLAAMINHLNETRALNIISLEDPIEFVHPSKKCQVIQRELGTHLTSFADGVRSAMREDPDVILVGELRDAETISMAMTAAETGHLVLGTLHTTSAVKTVDRIIDALPAELREQTKAFLSMSLKAVVTQVLCKTPDGRGRRAVLEILVNNRAISKLITTDQTHQIPSQLQTGKDLGMQLMDQALMDAIKRREIDPDDAFRFANDKGKFTRFVTDTELVPVLEGTGSHKMMNQ